jgi:anti-sigma B factor antagonist
LERHALKVTVGEWNGAPVIQASGELDLATVPELRAVVNQITDRSPQVLVFDFTGIRYMDSSGLGILVSAKRRLGAYAGEVIVVSAAGCVLKALSLSGLDQIITIYPSEDDYRNERKSVSRIAS